MYDKLQFSTVRVSKQVIKKLRKLSKDDEPIDLILRKLLKMKLYKKRRAVKK